MSTPDGHTNSASGGRASRFVSRTDRPDGEMFTPNATDIAELERLIPLYPEQTAEILARLNRADGEQQWQRVRRLADELSEIIRQAPGHGYSPPPT